MPGQRPSFVSTSLWQIAQASALMRTALVPGSGISPSTISKSAPALGICAAFMGANPILVVAIMSPFFLFHLENDFQLDRGTERKACNTIYQAARALVFSESVLQQLRSGVSDFALT